MMANMRQIIDTNVDRRDGSVVLSFGMKMTYKVMNEIGIFLKDV